MRWKSGDRGKTLKYDNRTKMGATVARCFSVWSDKQLGSSDLTAIKPVPINSDAVIALIWDVVVLQEKN
jgi:hypothetical protein